MSEDFRAVTRKKWIARKTIRSKSHKYLDNDTMPIDKENFLKHFEVLCTKMETSAYFANAMTTLEEAFQTHGSLKPTKIVCFGIGSFSRNYQSLHQLAFIQRTRSHFEIKDAEFFDPVFRDGEKLILSEIQCSIMKENCEAKYLVDVPTLFYLPHCSNCLTNNLLWRNWKPEILKNVILISNSFDSLITNKPDSLLRIDAGYILEVKKFTTEFPLDDIYGTQSIFNDLSLHLFNECDMPSSKDALWEVKDAPAYRDESEMITTEDFIRLKIN